jgi:uncharacterized protein YcbK (DUF882 family)
VTIKLTDAAEFFKKEPQQIDAWNWLQAQVSPDVLESFAVKYRNKQTAKTDVANTWEGVLATAKQAGAKWPECVAAQWALESGWGKHFSGTWNAFGLKGSGSKVDTQEFINGKWVTIKAGFIDFPDLKTCIYYLVDRWYKDFGKYKGVNKASSRNECARLLVEEGYATDPNYSTKLIQIMDKQLQNIGEKESKNPHENNFTPQSPFSYKVTPNITYGELTLNQEVRRFTKQYQCDTAKELCLFLERVRKQFGNKPLIITSASRPEPINTQVGGAKNSEHTYSSASTGAIDFYVEGADINAVQAWCDKNWPYSLGYGAPKGFVHIGVRDGNPRVRWNY